VSHPCLKTPLPWIKTCPPPPQLGAPPIGLKPPWNGSGQISCPYEVMPPLPPLLDVALSGRCPCRVHPRSQPDVRSSFNSLVTGGYFISACNSQVALHCPSRHRLEVVMSVMTQPPKAASLKLPSLRGVRGRRRRKVLRAAKCLSGSFFPNFKPRYRSSRKGE
jgi:hypothetical protein